jgi:hypothetical protein
VDSSAPDHTHLSLYHGATPSKHNDFNDLEPLWRVISVNGVSSSQAFLRRWTYYFQGCLSSSVSFPSLIHTNICRHLASRQEFRGHSFMHDLRKRYTYIDRMIPPFPEKVTYVRKQTPFYNFSAIQSINYHLQFKFSNHLPLQHSHCHCWSVSGCSHGFLPLVR